MNQIKNSFTRILATSKREFLHIIRDIRTLYLSFLLPIMLIFLFGYAVDIDIDRIPIGVCSYKNDAKIREFIDKLTAGHWFELKLYTADCKEIEEFLKNEKIHIGIILPIDFTKKINRKEPLEIQAIIDGSDNTSATTGLNYLKIFIFYYQEDLIRNIMNRFGLPFNYPLELRPIVLFNSELKSKFFLLPGIIVLVIAILSALLTSLTISREWELGTMEQLISTPIKSYEIIIGKLIPYIGISILQTFIVSIFAVYYFNVPFKGRWFYLILSSLFFSIGSLSLGMMISSVMKSQLPSIQAAMLATMIPTMIFSGFVFPIESMPIGIQFITYLIAPRYFLTIIRSIFLKGTGIEFWYMEILFLILYSLFILTIATKKLKKRLE